MKQENLTDIIDFVLSNNGSAFFYTPPIYKKAKCYLFTNPNQIVHINSNSSFSKQFNLIDEKLTNQFSYALLNYELGYIVEPTLNEYLSTNSNLGVFAFFDKNDVITIKTKNINFNYTYTKKHLKLVKNFTINSNNNQYAQKIKKIKAEIESGNTYQVNFTLKTSFKLNTSIQQLFFSLLFSQSAKYAAIININNKIIISFSPELFFKIKNNTITVAPMKGTIKRGCNLNEDKKNKKSLKNSEKEKAENLMIVDLMRNDIGKICKTGSVKVKQLFKVEKYETLFQMISIIKGELLQNKFSEILKCLFPCGSITGAPKIKTMKIIKELEQEERGLYTGAIGFITNKFTVFNVAIRTLIIDKNAFTGTMGVGSGIVWDGIAENEFKEVLLKAKFLLNNFYYFELFESILVTNNKPFLLNEHLERLKNAANYFMFSFNKKEILFKLKSYINSLDNNSYKLKITLNKWGGIKLESQKLLPNKNYYKVAISKTKTEPNNKFLYFKTTLRALYDKELSKYKKEGFDEVLFINENNNVTEGSFTNIFIELNGKIFTPTISSGILNGIYRSYLLNKNKQIEEKEISYQELLSADKIFICNSVRKIINVKEIWYDNKLVWQTKTSSEE